MEPESLLSSSPSPSPSLSSPSNSTTPTPPSPPPPPPPPPHPAAAGDRGRGDDDVMTRTREASPLTLSVSAASASGFLGNMMAAGGGGGREEDHVQTQMQQQYSAANKQLKRGRPTNSESMDGHCRPYFSLTSPSPISPPSASPVTSATTTLFSPAAATARVPVSSSHDLMMSSSSSQKRSRGRPPGSGKRHLLATLGEWFAYSAGGNFTAHVVTVAAGEDVAARIMSFSQKGPRAICILSANGAISNVTLRQPGSSGGTLTYEGRFEILSLSGSFTITENSGARSSRTGGISVSLAGPDGRVVGGGVAGLLLAASPIQVVVGSFLPNTFKEHKKRSNPEPSSFSPHPATLTAARPLSQANPGDDSQCQTPTSTLQEHININHGEAEISKIANPNSTSTSFHPSTAGWHGLQLQSSSSPEHKPSPDINLSLPGE